MIRVRSTALEDTRGARGCFWLAKVTIGPGLACRTFEARSQHGAPNALARMLVEAGIPDDAMVVLDTRRNLATLTYPSFHKMAKWTYEESAKVPLRRVRWKPAPDFQAMAVGGEGENRGEVVLEAL